MEDFGELPEGDQGQLEGHRTFRALEALQRQNGTPFGHFVTGNHQWW
jgi:hypothetical protein